MKTHRLCEVALVLALSGSPAAAQEESASPEPLTKSSATIPSGSDDVKVAHSSPDGKFALRVQRAPDVTMFSTVALVTQPGGQSVHDLVKPEDGIGEIDAVWSPDGNQLAFYRGSTGAGVTEIWRGGSDGKFELLELPEIALPFAAEMEKTGNMWVEDFTRPSKWIAPQKLSVSCRGRIAYQNGTKDEKTYDYEFEAILAVQPTGEVKLESLKKVRQKLRPNY